MKRSSSKERGEAAEEEEQRSAAPSGRNTYYLVRGPVAALAEGRSVVMLPDAT